MSVVIVQEAGLRIHDVSLYHFCNFLCICNYLKEINLGYCNSPHGSLPGFCLHVLLSNSFTHVARGIFLTISYYPSLALPHPSLPGGWSVHSLTFLKMWSPARCPVTHCLCPASYTVSPYCTSSTNAFSSLKASWIPALGLCFCSSFCLDLSCPLNLILLLHPSRWVEAQSCLHWDSSWPPFFPTWVELRSSKAP